MADMLGPAFSGGAEEEMRTAKAFREELARLGIEQGKHIQQKRDELALMQRLQQADLVHHRSLKDQAAALQDTTTVIGRVSVGMEALSGVFQKFASGNVMGGVLAAFGAGASGLSALGGRWQGQADDKAQKKHDRAYSRLLAKHREDVEAGLADKGDRPVKGEAPKGVSMQATAVGAIGTAGNLVVQAFQSVASGALTLWSTMTGFASSVPGVGRALSSVFTLISTKVTQALLPKIVDVAAWLVTFSDTIAQVISDILLACASFVEWMAKAAVKSLDPTGGAFKDGYDKSDERTKKNIRMAFSADGTDPLEKQQAEEKKRRASFDDNKTAIWKTIMAGNYQPQVEQSGDQAWKRIQMGELGTNDIDRQTLDVLKQIYEMGEKYLTTQKAGDPAGFAKFLGGALGFR